MKLLNLLNPDGIHSDWDLFMENIGQGGIIFIAILCTVAVCFLAKFILKKALNSQVIKKEKQQENSNNQPTKKDEK